MALVTKKNLQYYHKARDLIHDGDVLLYRASWKLSNKLIAKIGKSPYCHAAMAGWWRGQQGQRERLFLLETVQFRGARTSALSEQVKKYPGQWDVYRVDQGKSFYQAKAVRYMIDLVSTKYGWCALGRAALLHLPFIRYMLTPEKEDELGEFPFCSMAVSAALRAGRFDPCTKLADTFTEPGDLAESLEYKFTLDWDPIIGDGK